MDKFQPREGTPAPYWRHMAFIADSMQATFRSAYSDYISVAPDFYIDGAVVTESPAGTSIDYAITDGHVCFKGELMPVHAHNITKLSTQVVYIEVQDDGVDIAPVLNLDGNTDYVMRHRHAVLRVGPVFPAVHMVLTAPRKASIDLVRLGGHIVPTGGIIPYFGDLTVFDATGLGLAGSTVDGWAICNGLHGTPDLRGKALLGATNVPNSGAPGLYAGIGSATTPGDTLGADEVLLTVDQIPAHTHPFTERGFGSYPTGEGAEWSSGGTDVEERLEERITEPNATTGELVDVRQASFALVWLMSIA